MGTHANWGPIAFPRSQAFLRHMASRHSFHSFWLWRPELLSSSTLIRLQHVAQILWYTCWLKLTGPHYRRLDCNFGVVSMDTRRRQGYFWTHGWMTWSSSWNIYAVWPLGCHCWGDAVDVSTLTQWNCKHGLWNAFAYALQCIARPANPCLRAYFVCFKMQYGIPNHVGHMFLCGDMF